MTDYAKMPDQLPEKPTGWTRHMIMHLNFGHGKNGGGAASFEIKNAEGLKMPFAYQYDTRKGGLTGFTLPGVKPCMTWNELRALWPTWIERARAKQKRISTERE
jgi:hypothetical protein